jgi:pimeloyl-ACP methyl ester carboxylesterase
LSASLCQAQDKAKSPDIVLQLDTLYDKARERVIPVGYFLPEKQRHAPVVIFSHGYGGNKGTSYLAYKYLCKFLAAQGYFVASIQHELATDPLLPLEGNPRVVRRSNWERGAANILYVYKHLKRHKPKLDLRKLVLIGHSNGGDMSALFCDLYPKIPQKVITLDHRRYPIPRRSTPRFYTIRSNDQVADEGVLPPLDSMEILGIQSENVEVSHNDMDKSGTEAQHNLINELIIGWLKA